MCPTLTLAGAHRFNAASTVSTPTTVATCRSIRQRGWRNMCSTTSPRKSPRTTLPRTTFRPLFNDSNRKKLPDTSWSVASGFFLRPVGDDFCVFLSCRPLRSVSKSKLVWVIGPLICGTGHVCGVLVCVQLGFGVFRVIFLLVLSIPPLGSWGRSGKNWPRMLGVIWIKLATGIGPPRVLRQLFALP